ncbi:hypothetical protein [Streptomyces sp. CBMA29]|uniref:hypothetical protein n=1 Tax=Streptomyces sp. CBMA29 TaxID=1896314 RepID=UPI00166209C1|nr:hypothetical protein [Streptomyces sp. CBMA29]MBD0734051.1 hypothetical protein [Streptomyces sp. CBMA29]
MGSTSYAGIPYPELPNTPNVPADMQALAARLDTVLSSLIGGGTLPGTPLNLGQVPGQISTLNARPVVQQAFVARRSDAYTITSNQNQTERTLQTLTIASQPYLRMMLVYAASSFDYLTATTDYLSSRILIGGQEGASAAMSGRTAAFSSFCMQTLASGTGVTLSQTVQADATTATNHTATLEKPAVLYALLLPWFGTAFAG